MRTATVLICAAALLLAGCAGAPAGGSAPGANTTETTTAATDTSPKTEATTTTETTSTTTTTADDPDYGDNLLSLSAVPNSTAENVSAEEKANFTELTSAQRDVFLEARREGQVNQDVFRFNDEDRIEYVRYEGQWYFLRVAIV